MNSPTSKIRQSMFQSISPSSKISNIYTISEDKELNPSPRKKMSAQFILKSTSSSKLIKVSPEFNKVAAYSPTEIKENLQESRSSFTTSSDDSSSSEGTLIKINEDKQYLEESKKNIVNPNLKILSKNLKSFIKTSIHRISAKHSPNFFRKEIQMKRSATLEQSNKKNNLTVSPKKSYSPDGKNRGTMSIFNNDKINLKPLKSSKTLMKYPYTSETILNANSEIDKMQKFRKYSTVFEKASNTEEKLENFIESKSNNEDIAIKTEKLKTLIIDDSYSLSNSYSRRENSIKDVINVNISSPNVNPKKYKALKQEFKSTSNNIFSKFDIRGVKTFKNVYDSLSENEENTSEEEKNKCLINDKLKIKKFWDTIIMFLILYSVSIDPYRLAFFSDDSESNWVFFEMFIDVAFMIEVVLNFFTPYQKGERIIDNHKKIVTHYLSTWFFIDFLSSFPTNFIMFMMNLDATKSIKLNSILKISRFYRVAKWLRVFRLIRFAKNDSKGKIISNIKINNNQSINRLLKSMVIFLIVLHICTCLWVYIDSQENNINSWTNIIFLKDLNNSDIYIASLYFNLVTILTIGYGDIIARTTPERIYNLFFMFTGVMIYSFSISSLSTIFIKMDVQTVELKKRLSILNELHDEYDISKTLYEKIERNVKFQHGRIHFEKFELLDILPYTLRKEVILSMNRRGISKVSFFKKQERDFIIYVLPLLRSLKAVKNDILISIGDYIEEMYIVIHGGLSIRLESFFQHLEVGSIKQNCHFGDILMYLNENSPYSLNCKSETCDLLTLKKNDFNKIKTNYNENILIIMAFSCNILENIEKRKRFIIDLYNIGVCLNEINIKLKKLNNFFTTCNFEQYLGYDLKYEEARDFIFSHDVFYVNKFLDSKLLVEDFMDCFSTELLNCEFQKNESSIETESVLTTQMRHSLITKGSSFKNSNSIVEFKNDFKSTTIKTENFFENPKSIVIDESKNKVFASNYNIQLSKSIEPNSKVPMSKLLISQASIRSQKSKNSSKSKRQHSNDSLNVLRIDTSRIKQITQEMNLHKKMRENLQSNQIPLKKLKHSTTPKNSKLNLKSISGQHLQQTKYSQESQNTSLNIYDNLNEKTPDDKLNSKQIFNFYNYGSNIHNNFFIEKKNDYTGYSICNSGFEIIKNSNKTNLSHLTITKNSFTLYVNPDLKKKIKYDEEEIVLKMKDIKKIEITDNPAIYLRRNTLASLENLNFKKLLHQQDSVRKELQTLEKNIIDIKRRPSSLRNDTLRTFNSHNMIKPKPKNKLSSSNDVRSALNNPMKEPYKKTSKTILKLNARNHHLNMLHQASSITNKNKIKNSLIKTTLDRLDSLMDLVSSSNRKIKHKK